MTLNSWKNQKLRQFVSWLISYKIPDESSQLGVLILLLSRAGRGVSEKVLAVCFCLGSGLFGSCNSD